MIFWLRMIVGYCLDGLLLVMLVSAVMSFVRPRRNRFTDFVNEVTAIVCAPLRALLNRFEFARRCPLDLSFLLTWIMIQVFRRFL